MKKMKRLLVAILSGLTAIACIAGVSACKNSADKNSSEDKAPVESVVPDTNININLGGDPVVCVHDYSVVYDEMAPTCDEDGYKDMGCSKCGVEKHITVKALGHNYGDASCTDPATCSVCGEDKDETMLAHTWVKATCAKDGYCSVCGEENEEDSKEDVAHTWVKATCDKAGYCSVCEEENEEDPAHTWVSAFGSLIDEGDEDILDLLNEANIALDDNGYYYYESDVCGELCFKPFTYCATCAADYEWTLEDVVAINAIIGDLEEGEEPTDNQIAQILDYQFKNCIPVKGYESYTVAHTMVNYFGTEEEVEDDKALVVAEANEAGEYIVATCTTGAVKQFQVCMACVADGTTIVDLDSLDDIDYEELDATDYAAIAAVTNGIKALVTVADNAPAGTVAPVYAKDFAEGAVLGCTYLVEVDGKLVPNDTYVPGKLPTCGVNGAGRVATAKCTRCEEEMFGTNAGGAIAALDCTPSAEAPACGVAVVCTVCGEELAEALEHVMVAAEIDYKPATCTEAGWSELRVCSNGCGATTYVAIEKVPHNYVGLTNAEGAVVTCVTGLYADGIYQCTECDEYAKLSSGKFVKTSTIWKSAPSKTNHLMSSNFVAATCTAAAEYAECELCGKAWSASWKNTDETEGAKKSFTASEIGKALGHSYAAGYKADCVKDGRCVRKDCPNGYDEDLKYAVVAAFGHNVELVAHEAVAATCTKAGNVAYFECPDCGKVSPDGVNFEYVVGEDADGNEVKVAHSVAKGGSLYVEAAGHTYVTVEAQVATCQQIGWNEYKLCLGCDSKVGYKEIAKKTHASDIKSCEDYVACNCSYLALFDNGVKVVGADGKDVVVAATGNYKLVELVSFEPVQYQTEYAPTVESVWMVNGVVVAGEGYYKLDGENYVACESTDEGAVAATLNPSRYYIVYEGQEYDVAENVYYKLVLTPTYVLCAEGEESTIKADWTGCGELIETPKANKVAHSFKDGYCQVCQKKEN